MDEEKLVEAVPTFDCLWKVSAKGCTVVLEPKRMRGKHPAAYAK